MRIVFMGSAHLACPCLDALRASRDDELLAIVTQPPRPSGRKLRETPCPAHAHVMDWGLPILHPENINAPEQVDALRALAPELIVVVAYGQILRTSILDLAPHGCINVHASLLPAYRGAAPIQWAIVDGLRETGVTTMQLDAGMDTGDILLRTVVPIGDEDTAGSLHDALAAAGAPTLMATLDQMRAGALRPEAQDDASATHARKISKADGRIDWQLSACEIDRRVRGFNPYPGASCRLRDDSPLRVHAVECVAHVDAEAGTILECSGAGPLIACGEGAVRLTRVQPAGKRVMDGDAWLRGHAVKVGEKVG